MLTFLVNVRCPAAVTAPSGFDSAIVNDGDLPNPFVFLHLHTLAPQREHPKPRIFKRLRTLSLTAVGWGVHSLYPHRTNLRIYVHLTPLESTRACQPIGVDSKRLTRWLNPLTSTLTKKHGEGMQ